MSEQQGAMYLVDYKVTGNLDKSSHGRDWFRKICHGRILFKHTLAAETNISLFGNHLGTILILVSACMILIRKVCEIWSSSEMGSTSLVNVNKMAKQGWAKLKKLRINLTT